MNVMERAQSGARPHPDAVDVTVVIVSHNTCQHLHAGRSGA